jgi:hypothetical protein
MRKFFSLSQCFLFCLAILFSFKSFAEVCPSPRGINTSITCTGNISTGIAGADGIYFGNTGNNINTVNMTGDITTINSDARGIILSNDSGSSNINTVNLTGNITTTAASAYGIYANSFGTNSTNTVNMTGNITTNGAGAFGIYLHDDSGTNNTNTVNMTGNISTNLANAYGIWLRNYLGTNSTNTVNMTGNITTIGDGSYGISLTNSSVNNNTNTVNMTGNISTTGDSAYGISLYNSAGTYSTNTVNMTGNISTTHNEVHGLLLYNLFGSNSTNTVNMTGNITTSGDSAYGILLNNTMTNSTNTVNMTGNITTSGFSAYGIYLLNNAGTNSTNTVNMTGNILTSDIVAHGIYLKNDATSNSSNTVNMTGNITTNLANALGIYLYNGHDSGDNPSDNSTNTVTMTGNIETNGDGANGINLYNYDGINNTNTFNMTGNITTTGNGAYGIFLDNTGSDSSSNTVNMTGNITTTGNGANGINLYNNDGTNSTNTVNIAGRISATGSDSYAIRASNDFNSATSSNTVQLNKGSSVIGAIRGTGDSSASNFLKLNLGAGASYSFATTGFTVTDLNGRPMVSGSAHAAGVGNVTTASQNLYERTSQITQSLDDRLRTHDAKQNTSQDFWVNTYYSDSNRGGQGLSGSNLSFNQYRSGITAGFNVKNSYTPTELIVNYEHGKLNIDEGNQGISSNSVMAGALFPDIKKLFTGTLSAKAMVGYSDFSGDRKVLTNDVAFNGSRNVTASYQSSHLTIGSAWTKTLYQTDKIILDTLVGIDLNTQHINSYSESDLFKWNGRTINQLQERVTLGIEMKPLVKPLTLFGRVGVERRDLISGENQNYAINNTAVSYNDSNQRNTYATLNAGAYYPLTPTVKAYAQVRYYDSTKDIDSLSGSIGISGQF